MQATEVMSSPALCAPTTSARKAASIMRKFDTGILLIVEDDSRRKLVGTITDRDLLQSVEIDATDLCLALRRVTTSKIGMPNALDAPASYP
jgi:CBS domain-containing protein